MIVFTNDAAKNENALLPMSEPILGPSRKVRNEARWQTIYMYVGAYNRQHGKGPSIREISGAVGIRSLSTTDGYINRMLKAGWLYRSNDEHAWLFTVNPD